MTRVIKIIAEGPQGPAGPAGLGTLAGLTDVTGTPGAGKAPVGDGAGQYALTDIATQAELDAEAATRSAADTAATAAIAALSSVYQPLDSDLTAIAALTTTSFGRSLLALADAAALRTAAGLGSAATHPATDFDTAGAAAAAQAASQPLDSDLTAIAALATTTFGRAVLALADAAALRTAAGLGTAATANTGDFDAAGAAATAQAASQPLDSDLTAIAALTTTAFGRAFLALADAAAGRTALGLGTLATQSGTFSGTSSGTNTGDQTTVSGNAGTATALQTGRTIDGQTFDGTANITVIAPGSHAATSKATPVDADELPLVDSAASNVLKKLTWANLKATIKAYTDTLYPSGSGTSSGTNTGDQTSVSGNAGTATALQTARTIDGQSFDGTAAITVIAPGTHAATGKTTPVDADELALVDSAASNVLKKLTWSNLKATLKTYFDTLYQATGTYSDVLASKIVGAYYTTFLASDFWSFAAPSSGAGVMALTPIFLRAGTLDRISQQQNSAGTASEVMRLGIYNDNGSCFPGTLLLDAGTIDLSTAAAVKEITINQVVTAGLYWLAAVKQSSNSVTVLVTGFRRSGLGFSLMPSKAGSGGSNLYDSPGAYLQTGVTGALPSSYTGTTMSASADKIASAWLRYSA